MARPRLMMTHRRRQVLENMVAAAQAGERVSYAAIARRCGLYSYREARRIVRDLVKMGECPGRQT